MSKPTQSGAYARAGWRTPGPTEAAAELAHACGDPVGRQKDFADFGGHRRSF